MEIKPVIHNAKKNPETENYEKIDEKKDQKSFFSKNPNFRSKNTIYMLLDTQTPKYFKYICRFTKHTCFYRI